MQLDVAGSTLFWHAFCAPNYCHCFLARSMQGTTTTASNMRSKSLPTQLPRAENATVAQRSGHHPCKEPEGNLMHQQCLDASFARARFFVEKHCFEIPRNHQTLGQVLNLQLERKLDKPQTQMSRTPPNFNTHPEFLHKNESVADLERAPISRLPFNIVLIAAKSYFAAFVARLLPGG